MSVIKPAEPRNVRESTTKETLIPALAVTTPPSDMPSAIMAVQLNDDRVLAVPSSCSVATILGRIAMRTGMNIPARNPCRPIMV